MYRGDRILALTLNFCFLSRAPTCFYNYLTPTVSYHTPTIHPNNGVCVSNTRTNCLLVSIQIQITPTINQYHSINYGAQLDCAVAISTWQCVLIIMKELEYAPVSFEFTVDPLYITITAM